MGRLLRYFTAGFPPRDRFSPGLSGLWAYVRAIFHEMPLGLTRLLRLQPLLALVTAAVGIGLMRAGYGYTPVAAGLILACLVYLALRLPAPEPATPHSLWARVSDYALQMALANVLLFVLPFYIESSLWPSRHLLFLALVLGLTLCASFDWLYERVAQRGPLRATVYYGFVFFTTLNFIFPVLFGLRNHLSILLSAALSALAMLAFLFKSRRRIAWRGPAVFGLLLGFVLLFSLAFVFEDILPPAPLKLISATPCLSVHDKEPRGAFSELSLRRSFRATMHTAIYAPLGISEPLWQVWLHDGREVARMKAGALSGGRREGFRSWAHHVLHEGTGAYRVQIWTEGGQLLGEGAFNVVP